MVYKWISLMMKPLGNYALLYMYMCLHGHVYVIDFYYMVILRSIMGPYGRPMIEVVYGEILFSLHRSCMRDNSSGRVVGMSTCCRPCWTYPGQHQCGRNVYYFLDFYTIKTYMYYVFKSILVYCVIQKHWWSLTLS